MLKPKRRRDRKALAKKALKQTLCYSVLILLTVSFVFPFLWLLSSSFKEPAAIFDTSFSLIPRDADGNIHFVLHNYVEAFEYLDMGAVFANTMIVCLVNTFLNLFLNSMAAYAFARIRFRGAKTLFSICLASMMVPGAVMLIPNFIVINRLGIYDTLSALILPFVMSVYNIFLLRQQFMGISREMEESARVDGAGRFCTYFRIVLPLVSPTLVVLGITTFMWNYNNFLWPLVATQSEEVYTLARSLGSLVYAGGSDPNMYPIMLAGSVIVSAPLIVIFFVLQKYILSGVTVGSVKG